MTTAEVALAVSLVSTVIAAGSLGWNIWATFIFPKPHFKVSVAVMQEVDLEAGRVGMSAIRLSATNHGPIAGKLTGGLLRLKYTDGSKGFGLPKFLVAPFVLDDTQVNAGFPTVVAVGDTYDAYLPHCA